MIIIVIAMAILNFILALLFNVVVLKIFFKFQLSFLFKLCVYLFCITSKQYKIFCVSTLVVNKKVNSQAQLHLAYQTFIKLWKSIMTTISLEKRLLLPATVDCSNVDDDDADDDGGVEN